VAGGRIYELGGPEVATYHDLMAKVVRDTQRSNPLLPLPKAAGKLIALPFAILPFKPLITADQVEMLSTDNMVSPAATAEHRTLSAFGVVPTPMDAILPSYLWRFMKNGQFDRQTA